MIMEGRLRFEKNEEFREQVIDIFNLHNEHLGYLEKQRVGAWMTWCLYLNEDCYLTAGCMDEVRKKMKELNATANKKKNDG